MRRALHLVRKAEPPDEAVDTGDTVIRSTDGEQWLHGELRIDSEALVVLIFDHDVVLTW